MAVQKAITGNPYRHDGGTILHAGNVNTSTGPIKSDLSLAETTYAPFYGSRGLIADGSPLESGTIGTMKANSNGTFNKMEDGKYVGKILGTRVAGQTNNVLRSGGSETSNRRPFNYARGNRRYHITAWSYTTGEATKGGSAGALVTYIDPETGSAQAIEPLPTKTVPGRLVFMVTGKTATKTTYSQNNAS